MTTVVVDGKERPEVSVSESNYIHIIWSDFYIILENDADNTIFFKQRDKDGEFNGAAVRALAAALGAKK